MKEIVKRNCYNKYSYEDTINLGLVNGRQHCVKQFMNLSFEQPFKLRIAECNQFHNLVPKLEKDFKCTFYVTSLASRKF